MEFEIRTDLPPKIKGRRKRAKDSNPHEVGLSSGLATVESREVQREEEISASANAPFVELEMPVLDFGRGAEVYGLGWTKL